MSDDKWAQTHNRIDTFLPSLVFTSTGDKISLHQDDMAIIRNANRE